MSPDRRIAHPGLTGPRFLGIDPGLSGALAILDDSGQLVLLEDLPTIANGKGKSRVSRSLNPAGLAALLEPHRTMIQLAAIERVAAMPGQGTASIFSLGDSFGVIRGVLASLGVPVETVPPAKWKRRFGLDSDKERSRTKAISLFPTADLHRKKDHNRAEALLLALYACRSSEA